MGMKPNVPDDGAIQQQIGSAYDVVKSVADNLPAIIAVTAAVEEAQVVITQITEQVELATEAANNATAVVAVIEDLKTETETARDLAEGYKNQAETSKNTVVSIEQVLTPALTDFNTKYPDFLNKYGDFGIKYGQIVTMHDDVDADRIAAENARNKAEKWATELVDVEVEPGKYSAYHSAVKASGFKDAASTFATTASTHASNAATSVINAANFATDSANSATTATNKATEASGYASEAQGYRNTTLGYKDLAYQYKLDAEAARDDAQAIVGGDYVPSSRTVNGKALSTNISLNATDVGARADNWVPTFAQVTVKPSTLSGYGITDAVNTTGSGATGNWNISISGRAAALASVMTPNTTSTNNNTYVKFLSVTVPLQYQEYNGLFGVAFTENSQLNVQTEFLSIRVKQNLALGNNPAVYVTSSVLCKGGSNPEFGYVIVQNTPTVIVDFYLICNSTFTLANISTMVEKMSTGGSNTSRTWYTAEPFVTLPAGYVAGARQYVMQTTATDQRLPWASINPATSISNLQTLLENASTGVLVKTAASTYSVRALTSTDIPSLDSAKITSGTFSVARGGTGVASLSGIPFGNGTSAFSVATPAQVVAAIGVTAVANATAAVTATRFATPVTINGISFDGSANIVIPAPGSVATADALTTARAITISGDADWSVNFKGNADVTAVLTLKNVATAGTGTKVTYNSKGLVTGSSSLSETDIPSLSWSKITSGVPSFALTSDSRFTDAREWTAATVTQAAAEAGTDITRVAWTAQRVAQAIAAQAAPKVSTNNRLLALESATTNINDIEAMAIIGMMR